MEGGAVETVGSSLRGQDALWTSSGRNVFSHSARDEDDEKALKWAALERLPTMQRVRKGLLATSEGTHEVHVKELGMLEKRALLGRLVKVTQKDNEKFLLKLKERIDRVGVRLPTVEVRFEHLNIEAQRHVGARATLNFLNFMTTGIEDILTGLHILQSKKKRFTILKDSSGIIKPARLTLLLGPPSSGKTTLLLALSGKLDSSLKVSGTVTYNGHKFEDFVVERTAAYVSQHDDHIPDMTVRETLAFSARCQGVGWRYEMLAELARREKAAGIQPDPDIDMFMKATATEGSEANLMTDYIIKILGLEDCEDIIVGDDMTRGISGGQRKRVTTGEILVGPATVMFMDEISTGLDTSTTYNIVNCLKQTVHIMEETALVSLLQPSPETFDLFDDIILLSDSRIVYQGPREQVIPFFEYVGFKCPERKGVADFLQEVTSKKDQKHYWARKDVPYRFITAEEFVEAYQCFSTGKALADELSVPFDKAKSHPAALTKTKYGAKWQPLLKASFSREFLLMKRGYFFFIFKITQLVVMGSLSMTLFLRTEMHKKTVTDGAVFSGYLFFAVTMVVFNGMAEIPLTIARLPVFFKQRGLRFFPAWIYTLPSWLLSVPVTILDTTIWTFIPYYVVGFDPSVSRLFKQFLAYILLNQTGSSLFRAIASTCRSMAISGTFGSFTLVLIFILGGFVLTEGQIKPWWKWGYWTSPLMYGQNALMVNEFLGNSWNNVLPNSTMTVGVAVLKSKDFFTSPRWYWIGILALTGFIILFNLIYTASLAFLKPHKTAQATASEETHPIADKNAEASGMNRSRRHSKRVISALTSEGDKRGMVLPFEPHSLTFADIIYSVDMPNEMRLAGAQEDKLVLLKGVSGTFRPGVLTALMGVSGAGKTTLLDVLAGRKTGGFTQGSITVSGYPKRQETFARVSGYCEQNDIHSPNVSVYESLVYSAWLRLSPELDRGTRMSFVEEVMELVDLNPLRNTMVGVPGVGGLSTEQRKRLTIAVELVANPSIIFMDEPTSGLDARAAAIVMRTVRNTVDTGRTVVCTIHQPSIDIFEAFDELLLLKRGGEQIYAGPLGHQSCHLVSYLEGIEGIPKIKDGYNPATWMLEVTSPAQEEALGVDFAELYRRSDLYKRTNALIEDLSKPTPGSTELHFDTIHAQSFYTQCMACLWKQHRSYWSNPAYTSVRFLFTTFIALVFGTMFWDLGSKVNSFQDLSNALGSMYASLLFLGTQNVTAAQPVVYVERAVFYRERAAGMYSSLPYAFGQTVIELPYVFLQSLVFVAIVYPMMSFEWSAAKFLWYLFFLYLTLLYFTYYGMTTVAVTPTLQTASIISTAFYGLWNLFSGFIIARPKMPVWWRWYSYINPVAWTLYGSLTSQYGDVKTMMETGETVQDYLENYFGFEHSFLGPVAVIVAAFTVVFAFVFGVAIKYLNFQSR